MLLLSTINITYTKIKDLQFLHMRSKQENKPDYHISEAHLKVDL
jgi:hypothetical protein